MDRLREKMFELEKTMAGMTATYKWYDSSNNGGKKDRNSALLLLTNKEWMVITAMTYI
jgi:hypothetical protein